MCKTKYTSVQINEIPEELILLQLLVKLDQSSSLRFTNCP